MLAVPSEEQLGAVAAEGLALAVEWSEAPACIESPGFAFLPGAVANDQVSPRLGREEAVEPGNDHIVGPVLEDVFHPVEVCHRDAANVGEVIDGESHVREPLAVSFDHGGDGIQAEVGGSSSVDHRGHPPAIAAPEVYHRKSGIPPEVCIEPLHERPAEVNRATWSAPAGPCVVGIDLAEDSRSVHAPLHYVFGMASDFGNKPWSWVHYTSVRTAHALNPGSEIIIWLEHEPEGTWWKATKPMVTIRKVKAPTNIFRNPICHPAHAADVVRLIALLEYGGTYLDSDVWCLRPFSTIEHPGWWMGRQGRSYGLCNATMGGSIASDFGIRWLESYRGFRSQGRDHWWDEHSVRVPLTMAQEHPTEIAILDERSCFFPLWGRIRDVFDRRHRSRGHLANSISVHLWESKTWDWLGQLTPDTIDRKSEIGIRLQEMNCL